MYMSWVASRSEIKNQEPSRRSPKSTMRYNAKCFPSPLHAIMSAMFSGFGLWGAASFQVIFRWCFEQISV